METKKSRYKITKKFLMFWTLFIGLGAICGALAMIIDPTGKALKMDAMLPYFQKLPFADVLFTDFTFSGFALLIVNGLTNIVAFVYLLKNKNIGIILGTIFGITLILWICIQFYMFPFNFMSTIYFIFGILQFITGYMTYVFRKQEEFSFNELNYPNTGKDKSKLVVYFSRMGYVKKVAYEYANVNKACLYEVKTKEKINGTLGFWWCGRFGMHKWDMPIDEINIDLSSYDEVIICSPIWVFSIAAPIRSFLKKANGKVKNVSYIFVHFTKGKYKITALEADKLIGIKHNELINVSSHMGIFKEIKGS